MSNQITEQIAAALAAKIVNGNQIQNQGITDHQFGCLVGVTVGILLFLIGALCDKLAVSESMWMYAVGTVALLGSLYMMLGGHV